MPEIEQGTTDDDDDDFPALAEQDVGVAGTCYSARNCSGKVLNHKDAHNCKRSGGKSWQSPDGTCYNL